MPRASGDLRGRQVWDLRFVRTLSSLDGALRLGVTTVDTTLNNEEVWLDIHFRKFE